MSDVLMRGERDGVVIMVGPTGDFDEAMSAIVANLERSGTFFRGATVTLDLGTRIVTAEQLTTIRDILGEQQVGLHQVRASDAETCLTAESLGLLVLGPPVEDEATPAETEQDIPSLPTIHEGSEMALLIHRTLRNGQAVRHPQSVVILGDVNPGAEVIAGGDVIIFGALRGVVHAGASGDDGRMVCALELTPTQLRIGSHIARPPEDNGNWKRLAMRQARRQPEMARVANDGITVEPWKREANSGGV